MRRRPLKNLPSTLPKMLDAKPLENNFLANQKYARYAQDLIQCWNSMDEDSKRQVVEALNKEYGFNSDIHNHEVAMMVLQQKIDGDFNKFL